MGSIEEETCRADAIEACEVASDARSVQAETEIDSILEVRKGWEASALGRYTSSPWTLNFFLVLLTRLACVLMTMHPKFYVQSTRLSFQRISKRIPGAALTEFFHHGGFSAERAHDPYVKHWIQCSASCANVDKPRYPKSATCNACAVHRDTDASLEVLGDFVWGQAMSEILFCFIARMALKGSLLPSNKGHLYGRLMIMRSSSALSGVLESSTQACVTAVARSTRKSSSRVLE